MSALRQALEKALVEDPDDRAAHAAYADHLAEQGDPRGELIQVQLALEDEQVTGAQRRRLLKREAERRLDRRDCVGGPGFSRRLRKASPGAARSRPYCQRD